MEELFDRRIVAGAGHAEGIVERGEERVEAKQKPGLIEAGLSQTSRSKDAARLVLPEDGGRLSKSVTANAGLSATRLVPQGLSRAKALGAKLMAGGVEGAGYGALHGAGHDEVIGDAASLGALAGIGSTYASSRERHALCAEIRSVIWKLTS